MCGAASKTQLANKEAHYAQLLIKVRDINLEIEALLKTKNQLSENILKLEELLKHETNKLNLVLNVQSKKEHDIKKRLAFVISEEKRLEHKNKQLSIIGDKLVDLIETKQKKLDQLSVEENDKTTEYLVNKGELLSDIEIYSEIRNSLNEQITKQEKLLFDIKEDTVEKYKEKQSALDDILKQIDISTCLLSELQDDISGERSKLKKGRKNLELDKKRIKDQEDGLKILIRRFRKKYKELYPHRDLNI